MNKKEEKALIDFYHYNTTNYFDQLKFERGGSYGYDNGINLTKHPNDVINEYDFEDILINLSSKRNMSLEKPIDKYQLLNLLYNSYRFKDNKSLKSPSPGRIYPLELYVIIKSVKHIEKGVYYYNREKCSLNYINNFCDIYSLNVSNNDFTRNVGCMLFIVCNIDNLMSKYGKSI